MNRVEMESRRMEAARELLLGVRPSRVREIFHVSRTTVYRWVGQLRTGGVDAMRRTKAPGRPSRLTAQQRQELVGILRGSAEQYGFEGSHWTVGRARLLIRDRFGTSYHHDHIYRLVHKLGFHWKRRRGAGTGD